jgi:predicted nuclease with TOPRIM domain
MPDNEELVNILRTVIQEEMQPLRQEVRTIVQEELNPVRQELHELRTGQVDLRTGQDELRQELQELRQGQGRLENKVDKLEVRMENEVIEKVKALFDGHNLRGDQIENLKTHLDERFDSIEIDTRYLVSRVSRLEKLAK